MPDLRRVMRAVRSDEEYLCDLAPSATKPLSTAMKLFHDDFVQHIEEGRCAYRERATAGGGGQDGGEA